MEKKSITKGKEKNKSKDGENIKNKNNKENDNNLISKKRKRKNSKKNKPKKQKNKEKNKVVFKGINGIEYDEEGKEKENLEDSESENNEVLSPFVIDYLEHIKASSKANKAKKYLEDFKNKKWKFNKMMQIFLLKFILYENVFEKKYFDIFLEYIVNMFNVTKNSFIKKCEELIELIKKSNENEADLNFKIGSHELKFNGIDVKKKFLISLNKRCTDIIENN